MKYLIFIASFAYYQNGFAQMLLSPFGGVAETSGECISFSLGEVAVTTLQNPANALTQGFEQPTILPKEEEMDLFIPNGIIVDDNGGNNLFKIENLEAYPNNEIYILNRWGETLFHANPYQNDWKGYYNNEPLPQATYYYIFYPEKGKNQTVKGNLYVLR